MVYVISGDNLDTKPRWSVIDHLNFRFLDRGRDPFLFKKDLTAEASNEPRRQYVSISLRQTLRTLMEICPDWQKLVDGLSPSRSKQLYHTFTNI